MFSYHLPRDEEPGAFRPWMEARLLKMLGFEVTVITSGVHYMTGADTRSRQGWVTEEWVEGIRILKTWAPRSFRRSIFKRLYNYLSFAVLAGLAGLIKSGRTDWVFAGTDPILLMPVVFLVTRLKRAGLVLDERDLYPETAIALGIIRKGSLSRLLLRLQQYFRKHAHHILAATPGIRNRLAEYGYGAKVQLLYNADVFLNGSKRSSATVVPLRVRIKKKFLAGYAGGLGQANDVWTILRAARRLRDELPDLGFVIIGTGENLESYRGYCQNHQLDNVFFLGARPREETRELIKEFDLCLAPLPKHPHFSYTLTSKIFDYHGLGKPIIFSGMGDSVNLLAASGAGLAVPPEDDAALAAAIKDLVQDAARCQQMAVAGRQWFDQNISVAKACDILRRAFDLNGNYCKGG